VWICDNRVRTRSGSDGIDHKLGVMLGSFSDQFYVACLKNQKLH